MKTLNIAIYSRKSRFSDKSESTDNQVSLCTEYCKTHFEDNLNFTVYEDEGYSGKNTQRPAFKRMNTDILTKKIDVVVCYKIDRISRDVSDFNILIKQLEKLGVDFICIKEQFDTTTPMGRAMMNISATFAQLERETIGERITDNLAELSKQGRFISSQPPYGYIKKATTYIDKNGKEKKMNILVTDEKEMEIIKLVFDKYLELESINKVASFLLVNGYKTKKGYDFSLATLRRILSNQYYCKADKIAHDYFVTKGASIISNSDNWIGQYGVSVYRRINTKTKKYNDSDKLVYSVGTHQWFIDSKTFIRVQEIILGRRNLSIRRDKASTLLSGILKCSVCGSYLRPQSHKNGTFYYVCERKEKSHKRLCNTNNIRGDILDQLFISQLQNSIKSYIKNTDSFYIVKDKKNTKELTNFQNQIIENTKKIKELKETISKLIINMSKVDDKIAIDYITKEINILNQSIDSLTKDNNQLQDKLSPKSSDNINLDLIHENINQLLNFHISQENNLLKKRKILKTIIKSAYWDGNKLTVDFL